MGLIIWACYHMEHAFNLSKLITLISYLRIDLIILIFDSFLAENVYCRITDLVTFTEEILNGKLHFSCSDPQYFTLPSSFRYDEVCLPAVDFKKGTYENAESFTQMIWKDTRRFGIATATGKKGNQTCTYVAALYRPPGNIEEFYSDNIFIGKLRREQYCDNVKRNAIQRIYKKNTRGGTN